MTPPLSSGPALLFCPGDRPDRFAKASARADVVILDLEDAVVPAGKEAARDAVAEAVAGMDPERTIVRVNAPQTPWWQDDLAALADTPLRMVMVAKAERAADLAAAERFDVVALCETAAGVVAAPAIAAAPNCIALMWGGEDLMASLGGRASRQADGAFHHVVQHARSTVLLAAGAFGRTAIDSVYIDIADTGGLARETAEAASIGFGAKACIHPSQVATVRDAFAPDAHEVAWARDVLEAARTAGTAGVFAHQGRMIDAPLLRHAESIISANQTTTRI